MNRCSPPEPGDSDGAQRSGGYLAAQSVSGSTCELDSQSGLYNPGMQWLASGVLEWVRKLLWTPETPWQTLIDEARAIPAGAEGVRMQCDLLACQNAGWQGVTLNTTRGHFYRAALEA